MRACAQAIVHFGCQVGNAGKISVRIDVPRHLLRRRVMVTGSHTHGFVSPGKPAPAFRYLRAKCVALVRQRVTLKRQNQCLKATADSGGKTRYGDLFGAIRDSTDPSFFTRYPITLFKDRTILDSNSQGCGLVSDFGLWIDIKLGAWCSGQ